MGFDTLITFGIGFKVQIKDFPELALKDTPRVRDDIIESINKYFSELKYECPTDAVLSSFPGDKDHIKSVGSEKCYHMKLEVYQLGM